MKSNYFILTCAILFCTSFLTTSVLQANNDSRLKKVGKNWPEYLSENALLNESVPTAVLERFYETYVFDLTGNWRGADATEILGYATYSEIESIITSSVASLAGTHIFPDYRPKGSNGCKRNDNWVCSLEGDIVN